ncbi:unnamed protein product [Parnassius mnemosyne]|uniref:Reverse transcriptase domain-containing protein n=1 Tax=Parnassius mnemosyne TaxID=213953 RepID=A0AAV1L484_9NEOP
MASPSATDSPEEESTDVPEVTQTETRAAVSRLRAKNTAPGPDGVPGRALVLALKELEPQLRGLFTACLEQGQFPSVWKEGRLVLLRKEGRPADSPSAYRPIVLLDEAGKLLERIVADRLVSHLCREGPDLDENQFGFRRGRSTIDAITRVRALAEETVSRGGVVLAVSLDISNAFNTLPWSCIREALNYHRVPPYLRRTIGTYLEERCVTYWGRDGAGRRVMSCGVPQGSVLGPLLWNIGYDWVLRATDSPEEESTDVPEVTQAETRVAVSRLRAKNTAPGPDGVPGRALVLALKELEPQLRGLFTACLEQGQFPSVWKEGRLVLLRKEGRPADSPSAYRPIVLLDEAGKLLERIIADRLVGHLCREGPDLDENQFGFRRGRSTIDAITRVRALAEETVSRGGVVLAVSLDISNAFNTLPWSCIREALNYHRVPPYLRRIIGAYLEERCITYWGRDGAGRRVMSCGVPQGSVLGPLLWNIGYDWVLRGELPSGAELTCYADDTLVTARGSSHREAALVATAAVSQVVNRIRRLGLEVALKGVENSGFSFGSPTTLNLNM